MKVGAHSATVGSMHQQKRLDVIANNIANSNSPGYKKDNVAFNNMLDQVTYTSMDQGPIRETGHLLDVALSGNGFLRVQTDRGVLYTRAGNLTVNKDKNLVTQDGWQVLGRNGPISIENTADFRVLEQGQVFDKNNEVDSLDIVQFSPGVTMKKIQNGYYEPDSKDIEPTPANNCIVRQGALEGANFNPVEEMVRMVETMRNFEAYQKTMQVFDKDLDGQLISRLAG
ncbi:MAG: flagellar hook-basal body protein [Syntrophobacteraceae bacterium]